jgi:LPS-assembly lipoprotein
MRRSAIKFLAVLAAASLLGGCGFQLRSQAQLPFAAAYVDAPAGSALGEELRQALRSRGKLASQREGAPVYIKLSGETRQKNILSLSGAGKVSEYRLEYQVDMSVFGASGAELAAPSQIHLTRDFTNNDNQALAMVTEEADLNRGMEQDALRQVLRRLAFIKP